MSKKFHWTGEEMGDMKPAVHDMQTPERAYSQRDFSKTTDYIGRQNRRVEKEASEIRKQDYKGRYS